MLIYSSLAKIDHACQADNMEYVWHMPMQEYIDLTCAYLQNQISITHQCIIKYNEKTLKNIDLNYRNKEKNVIVYHSQIAANYMLLNYSTTRKT